jgi:hypothetical protein
VGDQQRLAEDVRALEVTPLGGQVPPAPRRSGRVPLLGPGLHESFVCSHGAHCLPKASACALGGGPQIAQDRKGAAREDTPASSSRSWSEPRPRRGQEPTNAPRMAGERANDQGGDGHVPRPGAASTGRRPPLGIPHLIRGHSHNLLYAATGSYTRVTAPRGDAPPGYAARIGRAFWSSIVGAHATTAVYMARPRGTRSQARTSDRWRAQDAEDPASGAVDRCGHGATRFCLTTDVAIERSTTPMPSAESRSSRTLPPTRLVRHQGAGVPHDHEDHGSTCGVSGGSRTPCCGGRRRRGAAALSAESAAAARI